MTLASRPVEPLLDDDRGPAASNGRHDRDSAASSAASSQTVDALAGREAVGLDDDAAPPRRARGVGQRRGRVVGANARPRAIATPAASATSRQNAFDALDPRRGRGRAEDGDPGGDERVGDAGRQRRLRPDDDELDRAVAGGRDDRRAGRAGRRRRSATRGSAAIASRPGATTTSFDARLGGELPGERVLAAAAADDEDPRRHDAGHRRIAQRRDRRLRWRIGRQARSIVWVRSGPTETSTIGTPACSSSAVT